MERSVWDDTLDGLEWCLEEQRELLESGEVAAIVAFRPGVDLGPIPEHLLKRGERLLVESRQLEAEIETQLVALAKARGVVDRFAADHIEGKRPAYVDRSL
ncbi:MAG: hypothetical protein JF603_12795 [Acidobacteria bacterium]|nr:hypothetical protein [Acidobacteriota bacterium]